MLSSSPRMITRRGPEYRDGSNISAVHTHTHTYTHTHAHSHTRTHTYMHTHTHTHTPVSTVVLGCWVKVR